MRNYLVKHIDIVYYKPFTMYVHCIGDSHTWQFINQLPDNLEINYNIILYKNKFNYKYNNITFFGYRCCEDGAYAYNIEKRKNIIDKIISHANENDIIMFMFGEVDCRFKIKSQMLKNNTTIEDEVSIVVNKYINFIKNNYSKQKIIIWGPHPQHTSPTHPYIDCFDSNERNVITRVFNEKLEIMAMNESFTFISLFNYLKDKPDLNNYFINDTIHINPSEEIINIYTNQSVKN